MRGFTLLKNCLSGRGREKEKESEGERKKNQNKITNNWWWIAVKIYTLRVYIYLLVCEYHLLSKSMIFDYCIFHFFLKKTQRNFHFVIQFEKEEKKNSNGTSELSHWNNVCIKIKNLGRKNEKKYIFFVENTWRHSSREWIWQRERDRKWRREKEKEMESEIGLRIPSVIINKYLS